LHISELADHKIEKPQDVVKLGDEVEVKILRIDTEFRKIGLSLRRAQWAAEEQAAKADQQQTSTGVQTIPSDSDLGKAEKAQEQTSAAKETEDEPTQLSEQVSEAVEAEAGEVEQPKKADKSKEKEAEDEQARESAQADEQTSGDSSAEETTETDK